MAGGVLSRSIAIHVAPTSNSVMNHITIAMFLVGFLFIVHGRYTLYYV